LISVILYGSAAVGDDHQRFSDLNVFCVLRQVTPRELEDIEPVFRWWREQGNPAPLLMSEEEVRTSTDCFSIEFHDMRDRRRVLHGIDLVEGLDIDDSFYRAQVEYQLRAKLLRLRQKGAGVLHDKELLVRLMADSVSTFLVLGRHALRLYGAEAPVAKRDVLARIETEFALPAGPFVTLLELREEKRKAREVDARSLYGQYLEGVEVLVAAVDKLAK
jgi:hypothetical protein